MHYFLIGMQAVACAFIALHSAHALNKMSKDTDKLILGAYVILLAAGASGFFGCFVTYDFFNCIFAVGVALFLVANQRRGDNHAS